MSSFALATLDAPPGSRAATAVDGIGIGIGPIPALTVILRADQTPPEPGPDTSKE